MDSIEFKNFTRDFDLSREAKVEPFSQNFIALDRITCHSETRKISCQNVQLDLTLRRSNGICPI